MLLLRGVLRAAALVAVLSAGTVHSGIGGSSAVLEITDDTFDQVTRNGTWMVTVYAPWCQHCKQLEPAWNALAEEAKSKNLGFSVGKVDGTQQKVLMSRFHVKGYPSIYLLKGGRTYEYHGGRSLEALKRFALEGYKTTTPLAMHRAPNSFIGRMVGFVKGLPFVVRRTYRILHQDKGYSDLAIVLGFLAIPVFAGAVSICALDAFYIRRAREDVPAGHEHQE